jgi:hypothetical protein
MGRRRKANEPQNGIVIIPRKSGLVTKQVFASGYLQMTYHACPDPAKLSFRSPMVNDFNQDLCNGWFRDDLVPGKPIHFLDRDAAIVDRVVAGLKPFGTITCVKDDRINDPRWQALEQRSLSLKDKLHIHRYERTLSLSAGRSIDLVKIEMCQRGTFDELFPIDDLIADYVNFLPGYADILCDFFKPDGDVELRDFFEDWDNQDWMTGLLLGYPIENTISLLRR